MIENAIKKRALNGTAPLPELDPRLRSNIELLPQLEEITKEYGKKLQAIYNVKEGKRKRILQREREMVNSFPFYSAKETEG
jgi:hypothetical protein